MTANTTPIFTLTPHISIAQVTVANANRDGSGDVQDVMVGATNGTRISRITIQAIVTTTAGMVRLYLYDGVNTRLWKEVSVSAITPSATVQAFASVLSLISETALVLASGQKLRASTHNAETFNVIAEGGDY